MVSSTSGGAENVATMVTNQAKEDFLKIKMKKKKTMIKQKNMKIKINYSMEYAAIAARKGHMSNYYWEWKYGHQNKFEKAKKSH